jgi:2-succinyl-5-enolpyruvyl-6-hydroxy-3-cyclohexene-1-carboxylate synthase
MHDYLSVAVLEDYIHITSTPLRAEPSQAVTVRIEADPGDVCGALAAALPGRDHPVPERLQRASEMAAELLQTEIDRGETFDEAAAARLLSQNVPENTGLFLASSLPVRLMDWYADPSGAPVRVAANRGASGIDGTVASAAGFARGLEAPVTLLVGDTALLHDLNSLALLRSADYPVLVVVLNNNGGGIFNFLPISRRSEVFERFFANPHGLAFDRIAEVFGLPYHRPDSKDRFVDAYREAVRKGESAVIEVASKRDANVARHRQLTERLRDVLRRL